MYVRKIFCEKSKKKNRFSKEIKNNFRLLLSVVHNLDHLVTRVCLHCITVLLMFATLYQFLSELYAINVVYSRCIRLYFRIALILYGLY